jgi:hypothetical protein
LSLRFLQEPALKLSKGRLAILPTQLLYVLHKPRCVCVCGTRPSHRNKNAKDGAPHWVDDASEIKSLGHPPVPGFRRMLASHQRSLSTAREHNETAGQIASRELEIVRIKGALQRAEELSDDVAATIEGVL